MGVRFLNVVSLQIDELPPMIREDVEDFLERRLQTQVFKLGLAKSIHHARVLIRQRHIRVGSQVYSRGKTGLLANRLFLV